MESPRDKLVVTPPAAGAEEASGNPPQAGHHGPHGETPVKLQAPFGVNEVRLNAWQWLIALIILALVLLLTPRLWERVERFKTGPDYRIPYQLSSDYWLYGRRLRQAPEPGKIILLGDSVVWGEYVAPDGTLSHFLNQSAGVKDRFINGGVNGLFPLAQEGLLHYYGQSLRHRKLLVQCNLLWLTSPKADLSTPKEEQFNHSRLVPQFFPRIPCYRADANERLSAIVERQVRFISWVGHLQDAYFGQKSILAWTIEDDGGSPPHYPNAWKDPLAQITFEVPSAPKDDPQRGPGSPRHKPWFAEAVSRGAPPAAATTSGGILDGAARQRRPTGDSRAASGDVLGTTSFDWVELDASLQLGAFQRMVRRLQEQDNDVLVVLGPFNEHLMTEENRPAYQKLRDGVAVWLTQNQVPHVVPETLPSALYADASHPLTEGYELLAKRLYQNKTFQTWLNR